MLASSGRRGHGEDGVGDALHVHEGLGPGFATGLQQAGFRFGGHLGFGVADVDLAAGDVYLRPSRAVHFVRAGDRVLAGGVGGGVWPRNLGRDGAVVDDAASQGGLALHQAEGFLRAEEGAGQVDIDDPPKVLEP